LRVVEVESRSWGIDTPGDLEAFEKWLEASSDPLRAAGHNVRPDMRKEMREDMRKDI
jgi:hypothetical protein